MEFRRSVVIIAAGLLLPALAAPETVSRTVGQVTLKADLDQSFPGGVIVARVGSRWRLGAVYAVLDGRRSPLYETARGPRALVPVPVDRAPGAVTLGFEIMARRGRQRVPLEASIAPRKYASRVVDVLGTRRHLAAQPSAVHDSRELLEMVRTETPKALWQGPFKAPVPNPPDAESFGAAQTYTDFQAALEYLTDGAFGEYHRGMDFHVPVGLVVQAPAAGTVVFAGNLTVPGQVVILDHGQGVVSVLTHLSRTDVHEGEVVEGRAPIGLSGDSGVSPGPILGWRLYLHGIAIDPRVMMGPDPDL
jgi:murein DD-endopeptidase MepM/ murein hydrolase activator NlpD